MDIYKLINISSTILLQTELKGLKLIVTNLKNNKLIYEDNIILPNISNIEILDFTFDIQGNAFFLCKTKKVNIKNHLSQDTIYSINTYILNNLLYFGSSD